MTMSHSVLEQEGAPAACSGKTQLWVATTLVAALNSTQSHGLCSGGRFQVLSCNPEGSSCDSWNWRLRKKTRLAGGTYQSLCSAGCRIGGCDVCPCKLMGTLFCRCRACCCWAMNEMQRKAEVARTRGLRVSYLRVHHSSTLHVSVLTSHCRQSCGTQLATSCVLGSIC